MGAFFLFFGAPTLTLLATSIRAKSPMAGIKAKTIFTFILKREAFIAGQIFLNPQNSYSLGRGTSKFIIKPLALILDQLCFIFRQVSEIVGERSEVWTSAKCPQARSADGCRLRVTPDLDSTISTLWKQLKGCGLRVDRHYCFPCPSLR
jgi:hypothetical protein